MMSVGFTPSFPISSDWPRLKGGNARVHVHPGAQAPKPEADAGLSRAGLGTPWEPALEHAVIPVDTHALLGRIQSAARK